MRLNLGAQYTYHILDFLNIIQPQYLRHALAAQRDIETYLTHHMLLTARLKRLGFAKRWTNSTLTALRLQPGVSKIYSIDSTFQEAQLIVC